MSKVRYSAWTLVLGVLSLMIALPVAAQEDGDAMAAMAALAAPGDQHEMLGKMVGDWTYSQKMWMEPGSAPMEATGTMEAEAFLDGRFVRAIWRSEVMGQAFMGVGINGYDNQKEQFTNVWMDNMGTGTMMFTGDCANDACTSTEMSAEFTDPASGQEMTMHMVSTWQADDRFDLVSHLIMADGAKFKNMEITATRSGQ